MKQHQQGFSLIELMVSVAILAILAAVGYPSMTSWFENRRLVGAAENSHNLIQYARSEAIKMGWPDDERLRVHIQPGASWCLAITDADHADCDCSPGVNSCQFGLPGSGAGGMQVRSVTGADFPGIEMLSPEENHVVEIGSRNGVFPVGAETLEFSAGTDKSIRLILSTLGRVRICSPNGSGGYVAC